MREQDFPVNLLTPTIRARTLIGTSGAAPYNFSWTNVTAAATDTSTSAAVAIAVDTPPTVSLTAPSSNAVFAGPAKHHANSDCDGQRGWRSFSPRPLQEMRNFL